MIHRLLILLALAFSAHTSAAQSGRKPNILFIVADDMGYADAGFHGSKDIPTPNLDALAKSGQRFTNGYVSGPVCSPTRAGLMTGRYQQRFGHEFNPGAGQGLPTSETTIANRLKAAGYVTGVIGKWHLGASPEMQPLQRGFDEFFGFLAGSHSYFDVAGIVRGAEPVRELDYATDAFGREAVSFIERHKTGPWSLYLAFNAPHTPMDATDDRLAKFAHITDQRRRTHNAMMLAMDEAIGRVRQTLADSGQEQNTLVIFISDNGGPTMPGIAVNGSRNEPLRGSKVTTLEGGIRVPFIVSWPGSVKPGVYDQLAIQLDLTTTALAAAGIDVKPEWKLDGVNLLPFLTGGKTGAPHDALYWRYGEQMAVRVGDYKLVRYDTNAETLTGVRGQPVSSVKLYNLATDIGETMDLAATQPGKVKELQAKWDAWNATLVKPLWSWSTAGENLAWRVPQGGGAPRAQGASPAAYDPIRLHPENPRYFLWRDKPTILIGASEELNGVVNAPFDYKTYLDTIAADRSNVISVVTGILLERGGRSTMSVAEGQLLPPWARSDTPGYTGGGNKFDLRRWDPAHFARLRDFVAEAGKRGIVVNVIILSAAYNDVHWSLNPFNPVNNVNGIDPRVARNEILTLDRHGGLLEFQEALVRKIVTELRSFDNVIYQINHRRDLNNMTMEWERHMIDVLDQAQTTVGNRKLMGVNLGINTQPGQEVDPRISVVNHINASPAAVAAHAGAKRAVGLGEIARELLSDPFARMRAWEFILAGAGMFIHADASFSVRSPRGEAHAPVTALSGAGPNQRRHLRILTEFMSTLDYLHLRPAPELLAQPLPDGLHGRVLARPGESYVVYVRIPSPDVRKARIIEPNGKVTFDKVVLASLVPQPKARGLSVLLDVTPGLYRIDWITPATGEVARGEPIQHAGGTLTLETPVFSEDIALRLLRDQSAVPQR